MSGYPYIALPAVWGSNSVSFEVDPEGRLTIVVDGPAPDGDSSCTVDLQDALDAVVEMKYRFDHRDYS